MKNSIKTALCLCVLAGIAAGCTNTVRGIGQDTTNAGHKIENSANGS